MTMRVLTKIFAVSSLFLLVLPNNAPALDAKKLFRNYSGSVVTIVSVNQNGKAIQQGSGFFVGNGEKIITNFHVIEDGTYFFIKRYGGEVGFIKSILKTDPYHDLALLDSSYQGKPLILAKEIPEVGEDIIAIGNPQGLEGTLSQGLISGKREYKQSFYYQITAAISSGSSGGPIINEQGEVIGVSAFQLKKGQNLNFAVPSKYISNLLSGFAQKRSPEKIVTTARVEKILSDLFIKINAERRQSNQKREFEIHPKSVPKKKVELEANKKKPEKTTSSLLKELEALEKITIPPSPSKIKTQPVVPKVSRPVPEIAASLQKKLAALQKKKFTVNIQTKIRPTPGSTTEYSTEIRKMKTVKGIQPPVISSKIMTRPEPTKASLSALSQYVELVQVKIFENWKDPLGGEGLARVSFYIFPEGNIGKPALIKSSGVAKLDTLALRAVKMSEPFPPFPKDLKRANLPITVNFDYVPE